MCLNKQLLLFSFKTTLEMLTCLFTGWSKKSRLFLKGCISLYLIMHICIKLFSFLCGVRLMCYVSPQVWLNNTTSNLEQVANLLYAQANSASYPQRDRKWVVAMAMGWRPSVADWGDGVSASCTMGPIVHAKNIKCSDLQAMDGHIMHCGIGSCQSADTSKIVKHCWSWVWLM